LGNEVEICFLPDCFYKQDIFGVEFLTEILYLAIGWLSNGAERRSKKRIRKEKGIIREIAIIS
jgi:hypothetical protein